ncbi:hypothetical protein JCM3770_007022 [Rhodotorula araucariae]
MPYVGPSPSTSPVATMSYPASPSHFSVPSAGIAAAAAPRAEQKRPARHHQRSHSSDPIPSTSSFIFVQPATPDKEAGHRTYSWTSSPMASTSSLASTSSSNGSRSPQSEGSRSPGGPQFNTIPRQQRRIRLTALTPAAVNANGGSTSPVLSSHEQASSSDAVSPRSSSPGTLTPMPGGDDTPRASAGSVFQNAFPFGEPSSSSSSSLPSPTLADDARATKPALMVRKKSGELVRPSLKADTSRRDFSKPRSAPATPVCPKYVHFDTQLEHVKHFLAQQRPAAVSRSGSPLETETEDEPESFPFPAMAQPQAGTVKLVLSNFPTKSRIDRDAYVESLTMTPDGKSIRGIVRVRNLAFEKWVAVRFTLDHWQTVSEVSAEHHESIPGGHADRFAFTIRLQDLLAHIEHKTMYLAVRYTVGGREIWDNNDGQNYRVEFKRVPLAPAAAAAARAGAAAAAAAQRKTAWSVTNAGQAADRMADLRRELDRLVRDDAFDDDDGSAGDASATTALNSLGLPANRGLRLGFGPESRSFSETNVGGGGGSAGRGEGPASLSGRYDFGNSLKMFSSGPGVEAARGAVAAGAAKGGMKERKASPRFPEGSLPHPATAQPFYDPVSTSPQRPRAPPLPNSSPPQFSAQLQIINGHPATVFNPSLPAPVNSHRASGDSPLGSPHMSALQPDFGMPSAASSVPVKSKAYFSPTLPSTNPRPQSPQLPPSSGYFFGTSAPPPVSNVGGLPYLPLQDATTHGFSSSHTRFNTYPGSSGTPAASGNGLGVTSPRGTSFSPLVPPAFREHRGRNSPFASPAPSPPSGQSPAGSPGHSTSPLPPVASVGRRLRSPPPSERADTSDEDPTQPWSPATTDSTSSTLSSSSSLVSMSTARVNSRREGSESSAASSLLSSPVSDATSVALDSPAGPSAKAATSMARPSNALEFSNFLDRYRFHLGSASPGTAARAQHGSFTSHAAQADFFNFASPRGSSSASSSHSGTSTPPSDSNSTTPQRLSPVPVAHVAAIAPSTTGPPLVS